VVRLTHSGLTQEGAEQHAIGWDHYLPRLVIAAGGGDAGVDPWMEEPPDGEAASRGM
jgi:hypothetical protein